MIYVFRWWQPGDWRHGFGAWTQRDGTIYRVWGYASEGEAKAALERVP